MINLKNIYKNSKYKNVVKMFLFLAFLLISLGAYFCFAPKEEVSADDNADDNTEYTFNINFVRADDDTPDLFAGEMDVYYSTEDNVYHEYYSTEDNVYYEYKRFLTLNDDGSYTFKVKRRDLPTLNGNFGFHFTQDESCDKYDESQTELKENNTFYISETEEPVTVMSRTDWANDNANRNFTLKFNYPNDKKYTKFKIYGTGKNHFMFNLSSSEEEVFEATDIESIPVSVNKKTGILVCESFGDGEFNGRTFKIHNTHHAGVVSVESYKTGWTVTNNDYDYYRIYTDRNTDGNTDKNIAAESNFFKVKIDRFEIPECKFTFQGDNSSEDLSKAGNLVQKFSAKSFESYDNDFDAEQTGEAEGDIDENSDAAEFNIDMFPGDSYADITLKARDGVIITGIVVNGNLVSSVPDGFGWDSTNWTYKFRLIGSNRSDYSIKIKGVRNIAKFKLQGNSSYDNQTLGALVQRYEVYVGDDLKTSGDIDDNVPSADVSVGLNNPRPVDIDIILKARGGMKLTQVSGEDATISDAGYGWNADNKTFKFKISSYPGEDATYTVSGELDRYLLRFVDNNKNTNSFSLNPHIENDDKTVALTYNTEQTIDIELDSKFSNSYISLEFYNLNIFGHPQIYNDSWTIEDASGKSAQFSVIPYFKGEYNEMKEYSFFVGDAETPINNVVRFSALSPQDENAKSFNEDRDIYLVVTKEGNEYKEYFYEEFHANQVFGKKYYISNKIEGLKVTKRKGEGLRGNIQFEQIDNTHFTFKIINSNINIDPNQEYFFINGIQYDHHKITLNYEDALNEYANNLNIIATASAAVEDDAYTESLHDTSLNFTDKKIELDVTTNDKLLLQLSADDNNESMRYVSWFTNTGKYATIAVDSQSEKIIKDLNSVKIEPPISQDCTITLKYPPMIAHSINFQMDSKFAKVLDVYKASKVSSADDGYELGEKLTWARGADVGNDVAAGLVESSHIVDSTFYYVVTFSDEDLKSYQDELFENFSATLFDTFGDKVSIPKCEGYTKDGKIHIPIQVDIKNDPTSNVPKNIPIKLQANKFPTCKATFVGEKNMVKFQMISGWKESEDNSGNDIDTTLHYFDYNTELVFRVEPGDNYEIYNIEQLEIKKDVNNEVNVPYDFSQYTTNDGKDGYEIRIPDNTSQSTGGATYNFTVKANFGLIRKTVTFNTIAGLSFHNVMFKSDSEGTEESAEPTDLLNKPVIKGEISGKHSVELNHDYYFAVKADQGYDLNETKLNVSECTDYTVEDGFKLFKIKAVQKDHIISGSIKKLTFDVNFKCDSEFSDAITYIKDGVPIKNNKLTVEYGDGISFNVEIKEKYNKSNFKIMDGDIEINSVAGKYSLVNITTHKDITVKDININEYNVNFVKSEAAEFLVNSQPKDGIIKVGFNEGLSFKIEAKTGYEITDQMKVMSVSESGVRKELSKDKSGNYILSGIKEDYEISVEDVENIMFKVDFAPVDGVTYLNEGGAVVSGTSKVKYGNDFEFSVNIDDAYDDSISGMQITVNDGKSHNLNAQKLATGRYIISNITEDIVVKVINIYKNSYMVNLVKVDGMDYYNLSKKVISGNNKVDHGNSLDFKVQIYDAYSDSKVKVMLGNEELKVNDSGVYTVPKVIENKTVTVVGVEENPEAKVIHTINNLPDNVLNLENVDEVISATRDYEKLTDEQKQRVSNIDELRRLQEQVKEFHHVTNDVRISGVGWQIKLVAVPISFDKEACTRIYKKLNSEYIISLYDIYLWDTVNNVKYTLPEGQEVDITLPKPDLTYFERPTGIHEKEGGKISYLTLNIGSNTVSFTTDSFSPMGIIANRSLAPGRSSLLDAADANVGLIRDYALSTFGSGTDKDNSYSDVGSTDKTSKETNLDDTTGNISEKFKSRNNPVTAQGSAIRLVLVLLLLILLVIAIIIVIEGIKRRRKEKE